MDSRSRTADTKRRRTRAALLSAARVLFSEQGWRTRFEDVARRAGVSTATAYNHFKNKQLLVGYVYRPLVRRLVTTADKAIADGNADPIGAIHDYFYGVAALVGRRRRLTESLVAAMREQSLDAGDAGDKPVRENDVRELVPLYSTLTKLIDNAQRRGCLRSNYSASEVGVYYIDTLLSRALTFERASPCETATATLRELTSMLAVDNVRGVIPPSPGDLSFVLRRLMAAGPAEDRRRLVNQSLTRDFLDAGLDFSGERGIILTEGSAGGESFGRITVDEIVERAKERGNQAASKEEFRRRWPGNEDYTIDLLSFSVWSRYWRPEVVEKSAFNLSNATDVVDAAHRVAQQTLQPVLNDPATRLSLVAAAIANRHTELSETAGALRGKLRDQWISIYAEMLDVYDLELREDVEIGDFADIMSLIADGLVIRRFLGPPASDGQILDLFNKSLHAVMSSFLVRGDERRLEEMAYQIFPAPR